MTDMESPQDGTHRRFQMLDIVLIPSLKCGGFIVGYEDDDYVVRLEYTLNGETVYAVFTEGELI